MLSYIAQLIKENKLTDFQVWTDVKYYFLMERSCLFFFSFASVDTMFIYLKKQTFLHPKILMDSLSLQP